MTFELYVHVPFCLRRCGYCDFNTYTAVDLGEGASRSNFANMAIKEMGILRHWQLEHGISEPPISTIFFGGGTPTTLPADDLVRMVRAAKDIWGIEAGAEITTEANPDTVDESYLAALKDGGFTRVSFGMQSAVPHVLKTLDRTHTPENVSANVAAAKRVGLEVSVDLIYGTPGESVEDWRVSVETALELEVNHISAYALSLEPTTKMGRQVRRGELPSPDDDDEASKYEIADRLFGEAGLRWYEISNWSVPGFESRHNLGYWRNVDWAAIGPGAHSHYARSTGRHLTDESLPEHNMDECFGIRAWDIAFPRVWAHQLNQATLPWKDTEIIHRTANIEETVMLGLRLREGLPLSRIEEVSASKPAASVLRQLHDEGLIEEPSTVIVPTLRGRLLNDALIARVLEAVDC
ncbi:radical SAM family heme chaperone HemW [Bifidobacterium crudilactis]|uniref:Heme chaperone HemW n=1 Tax=Bifidobacterium crudilactis TaxID=327277 RepID=A0A971CXP6_9BIFI|nr:radical SAM family heme chaperone HemW [Bifidobacterium crudilactis]NLT78751.1 coproporphyrinogen III oxidase [Bifidobacterium crudilactis]